MVILIKKNNHFKYLKMLLSASYQVENYKKITMQLTDESHMQTTKICPFNKKMGIIH